MNCAFQPGNNRIMCAVLPELTTRVHELEAKVQGHLAKMGFVL